MRTQLGTYCQDFDRILHPLVAAVQTSLAAVGAASAPKAAQDLRPDLVELLHHLQALADKVREQQAYVLIFGPLKSGKSTLMNAIAGAYVSEVSSLPAYPCLVFTSAGEQRAFRATSYDGEQRNFHDGAALHQHIEQAHGELAAAIRAAESQQTVFDPAEHLPHAIRRIDVKVPDSDLATTGAVLVDTPGLYTRMRFGYDRMTRDFRNAAACAIFVVKSDTLFLEQVFAEFQQLLDLFSRIFLVINIDSHKRDVTAEGRLVPSLEQSQPAAILRAFEQLAMPAPLQRAAAEGRVRMYPVDLMHAAAGVLRRAPREQLPAAFRSFQDDLTGFLASPDYLAAFLQDALQRAGSLLQDTRNLTASDAAAALAEQRDTVAAELAFAQQEQRRIEQALQLDWTEAFARGLRELDACLERCARDQGAKLLRTLGASIDTWFLSSHSLHWLVQGQWTPLLRDYRDEVASAGRRNLEQWQNQPEAGLDLPAGLGDLLRRNGIDLRNERAAAAAALGNPTYPRNLEQVPVELAALPLRKSLLDRVTLRSLDTVRLRLFGPAACPDTKLSAKDKQARLGEPGRLFLHQCVAQFRAGLVPGTTGVLREWYGAQLRDQTVARLRGLLQARLPAWRQREQQLAGELQALQAVLQPLRNLADCQQAQAAALAALGERFASESAAAAEVGASAAAGEPVEKLVLLPANPPGSQPRDGRAADAAPHHHRARR